MDLAEHFAHEQLACEYSKYFVKKGKRGQILPVYLRLVDPFDLSELTDKAATDLLAMDLEERNWCSGLEEIWRETKYRNTDLIKLHLPTNLQKLKKYGYDGLIAKVNPTFGGGLEYAVLSPTQIKSVNNCGAFDPSDPVITNPRLGNTGMEFRQNRARRLLVEAIDQEGGNPEVVDDLIERAFLFARANWVREHNRILPAKEWPAMRVYATLALAQLVASGKQ